MSTMQITASQRSMFADEGYCITPPLFDTATLDAVQHEFEQVWQERIAAAEKSGDPKQIDAAKNRFLGGLIGQRNAVCAEFCRHPELLRVAQDFLGPDVDLSWEQAIIKPPTTGKALGWHQDAQYAVTGNHAKHIEREIYLAKKQVTCWIAITRTTVDNGTLWVVPGRHKEGLLPHIWSEETNDWHCQLDKSGKLPAVLERGQALLFTQLTPHHSGPNVSDEVRMAYQIGFSSPEIVAADYQTPVLRDGKPV